MVLLTWRLMPAEVHPRWNREAWESQFYFTSRTLSGSKSLFAFDTASRHPLPTGPCSSVDKFISLAALCLGTRVSSFLTPQAANSCQLAPCSSITKFISPAALCLGAEFSACRTALWLDL